MIELTCSLHIYAFLWSFHGHPVHGSEDMSLAPSTHLYVSSTHSSSHALLSLAAGLPCAPVGSRVSDSVLIDLQRPAGDRTGLVAEV